MATVVTKRVATSGAISGASIGSDTWGRTWGGYGTRGRCWGQTWFTGTGNVVATPASPAEDSTKRIAAAPTVSVTKRVTGV